MIYSHIIHADIEQSGWYQQVSIVPQLFPGVSILSKYRDTRKEAGYKNQSSIDKTNDLHYIYVEMKTI